MDPLSAVGSVIACSQLASTVVCETIRFARGVKEARKEGELVVSQIQMFQLSLHHLQKMLAEEAADPSGCGRLDFLQQIISSNSASLDACSEELKKIEAQLVKAKSGGKAREVFNKLVWPLKQEEIERSMDILERFAAAVNRALNVDTNKVVRMTASDVKEINSISEQILSSAKSDKVQQEEQAKRRQAEEERRNIMNWLVHPDPSEIHVIASENRKHPKTGRWFLDSAAFRDFMEKPRSVLWLHGHSGCGKTVLCSAVIDELRAIRSKPRACSEPAIQLAYWYFSVSDAKRRSLQNFVRAMITQCLPNSSAPLALVKLWQAHREGAEAPKTSGLIEKLGQTLKEVSDTSPSAFFLVIDALDESSDTERAEIINTLQRVDLPTGFDIHMLITSRSTTVGFDQGWQDAVSFFNISIGGQHVNEDIRIHIAERLENDTVLNKWPMDMREEIEGALVERAAGIFRWVDYQLQAIRKCRKKKELRKALVSLPEDLSGVYRQELKAVEGRSVEDVRKLLVWLTYPQRPLRIEEAAEILAIDLDTNTPCFDEDNRMPRPEDVLTICGGLVHVDRHSWGLDSLGGFAELQTLTAAHASIVDFIRSEPIRIGQEREVFFTEAAANLEMAETCLVYLLNVIEREVELTEELVTAYPFARLSAELWAIFYREVVASTEMTEVDMTRVNSLIMRLFGSHEAMLKWIQLSGPENGGNFVEFYSSIANVEPAVYYAALLGLPDVVSRLIDDGHPVDAVGGSWGTALTAACAYGRENIVSILLENGADSNLLGSRGGHAFTAAIRGKHLGIVKLLLRSKSINVNAKPPLHFSEGTAPIYQAVDVDTLDILNALLEAGADPNIKGGDESTALQLACRRGRLDMVEVLLGKGANANMRGGESGSPLQAAYASSNLEIAKRLINVGVDDDERDLADHSGLYVALAKQDLQMVDFLLERGARIDLFRYDNPLLIASIYGSITIVRRLLKANIDVNRKGGHFGTALTAACHLGHTDVVALLLEHGADANIQGCWKYDNALQTACLIGNVSIVCLLLKHDADLNLHGGWYGSALHAAFSEGHEEIIRVLLEKGANSRYQGGELGTILQAAVKSGNERVVQAALGCGLSPNEKGGPYTYPLLQATASKTCPDMIVRLLLEARADPNLEREDDKVLRTALQNASSVSKARLLLNSGALVNTVSGWVGTALHAAIRSLGEKAGPMVKLLVDHGADINVTPQTTDSPLLCAIIWSSVGSVRCLVEAGANQESGDLMGHTALHIVLSKLEPGRELFDYFVGLGGDPLLPDRRKCNGLHYAARANKLDLLKRLLDGRPDVNATDTFGWTPLHWSAASTRKSVYVIKALLDAGCDEEMRDRDGETALDLARYFFNWESFAILTNVESPYINPLKAAQDKEPFICCDGCMIAPDDCGDKDWYRCSTCSYKRDLCFRCIKDKDIVHLPSHIWYGQSSVNLSSRDCVEIY